MRGGRGGFRGRPVFRPRGFRRGFHHWGCFPWFWLPLLGIMALIALVR